MPEYLAELHRTTFRALVRFLYRKVWDVDRAEDLAQEAFARALEHRPAPGRARGWLFVVAANMARDELRRGVRERRHLTLLAHETDASVPGADVALARDLEQSRVRAALDALTPRDREVLLLWDANLSYDEIAAQTGLARGAVGTTLARARRRLVEAYDAESERTHVTRG